MPIDSRRPFTEMFEIVQSELVREAASGEENKYKGFINQIYTNELPSLLPERFIKKEAFVTLKADYSTGTVTVGSGTTNIVGASTSWTSANSDDFNIIVDGFNRVYRMSFEAGTSLTFKNSLSWVEGSGTGLSYTIFQDRYQLASDFAYMASDAPGDPNIVYVTGNGTRIYLEPWTNEEFDRNFNHQVNDPPSNYTVKWTSSTPYVHLWPSPDVADILGYQYIPRLTELREHTTGTATLTTGTSVVLTSGATITASLNTARTLYIRNDADGTGSGSKWFKIASVANGSVATLSSNFTGTSGTGINYTISEISEWPERFDDAIMFRSAFTVDPDGLQSAKWGALFTEAISFDRTVENKRKRSHKWMNWPGARNI
jgi:hypothetical protein